MNEKIYTIPVMDGFHQDSECPFCAMKKKLNDDSVRFMLSPSYMEVDVRGETNRRGFCQDHTRQMYEQGNMLGLALMTHSHLKHRIRELETLTASLEKNAVKNAKKLSDTRKKWDGSCYLCERIEASISHYMDTFFYLWKKEEGFEETVRECKGFCLSHYLELLGRSETCLAGKEKTRFQTLLQQLEREQLERVAGELEWFTQKFDYRNQERPWKNSKDALPRALLKVNSQHIVTEEKP